MINFGNSMDGDLLLLLRGEKPHRYRTLLPNLASPLMAIEAEISTSKFDQQTGAGHDQ